MSGLEPEERVLTDKTETIKYCNNCFAMEYQPHCPICPYTEYNKEILTDDFDLVGVLLDSYYGCLFVSKNMGG